MKTRVLKAGIAVIGFLMILIAGWAIVYPEPDYRSPRYVLWKAGIYPMDLDLVATTLVVDPRRDELVVGKSEQQLMKRFGYLTPVAAATKHLQGCYQISSWTNRKVMFIRRSMVGVVFQGNKATDVVIMKGLGC